MTKTRNKSSDYRVNVRLPAHMYDDLVEISNEHKVTLSVTIRAFLSRMIGKINSNEKASLRQSDAIPSKHLSHDSEEEC